MLTWLVIVIIFLACLCTLSHHRQEWGGSKLLDRMAVGLERDGRRNGGIFLLGYGTLLKIALGMVTVNRSLASYEWAQMYSKVYGAIHAFEFPHRREVIVNSIDMDVCKKVMTCSHWANRFPHNHYMFTTTFDKDIGILFGNGSRWKEARRLTLRLLHQLNFFKPNKMELFIMPEIEEIVDMLGQKVDPAAGAGAEPYIFSPHQMFEVGTLNVVCQVIMERRFDHSDPQVIHILDEMNRANREFSAAYTILEFFPWLKHIPRLTFLGSAQRFSNLLYDFFRDVLRERREKGSYKDAPLDFVDGFLLELENQARSEDSVGLTDEDLLVVLRDMVVAGADTTNSALEHGILHVALQPHIQKRVQAEIEEVTGGNSRLPTYEDRQSTLYTQAVLLEILRIASPVPCSVRCNANEDMVVENTQLPKGTMFVVNVFGIHRSDKIWEDGEVFRPERFLNDNGELVNTEKIMPFGYGKRICIGESVAKVTLFIFFTTLLQSFSFEVSDSHPPPSFKNLLGLSRCPVPYYVKCHRRGRVAVQ